MALKRLSGLGGRLNGGCLRGDLARGRSDMGLWQQDHCVCVSSENRVGFSSLFFEFQVGECWFARQDYNPLSSLLRATILLL